MNARRREIARRYSEAFAPYDFLQTPPADDAVFQSSWHIYCLKVPARDDLCAYLQERGVATGVHYTPIHLYSCYGNKPCLPQAEAVFRRIVSLPMYPDLSDADVERVIDSVVGYYRAAERRGVRAVRPAPAADEARERRKAA